MSQLISLNCNDRRGSTTLGAQPLRTSPIAGQSHILCAWDIPNVPFDISVGPWSFEECSSEPASSTTVVLGDFEEYSGKLDEKIDELSFRADIEL